MFCKLPFLSIKGFEIQNLPIRQAGLVPASFFAFSPLSLVVNRIDKKNTAIEGISQASKTSQILIDLN
ncbi:MAG TPA: hypothetical protein DCR24_12175 [Bacillus bacterium]|nr:hypothetical protein [Bacillus sp. (in: firmicutes)]